MRRATPEDLHREALRRLGAGKRAWAPCGHPGEHVIGTFVRCLRGCDGVPAEVEPEKTKCLHARTGLFHAWGRAVRYCMDCKEQLR